MLQAIDEAIALDGTAREKRSELADGIELQRRIRLLRPKLPVIFISAHVSAETRQTALDEGAADFQYKPFDAAGLLKVVQAALIDAR